VCQSDVRLKHGKYYIVFDDCFVSIGENAKENCNQKYIGQTARTLNTRFVEQLTAFKNNHPDQSSIAFHMLKTKNGRNRNPLHTHIQHKQLETLGKNHR
jgi:hypothetical protein